MSFLNGQQAFCGHCKEPCDIKWLDDGIGPVEFWGAKSWHEDWTAYSDCCDDALWATPECIVEFDLKDWEPDFMEPDDDNSI